MCWVRRSLPLQNTFLIKFEKHSLFFYLQLIFHQPQNFSLAGHGFPLHQGSPTRQTASLVLCMYKEGKVSLRRRLVSFKNTLPGGSPEGVILESKTSPNYLINSLQLLYLGRTFSDWSSRCVLISGSRQECVTPKVATGTGHCCGSVSVHPNKGKTSSLRPASRGTQAGDLEDIDSTLVIRNRSGPMCC